MNTRLQTFNTGLFIAIGSLNFLLFGLSVCIGMNLDWTAEFVIQTIAFLAAAGLLVRAPKSRRNFENKIVTSIRLVTILLLLGLGSKALATMILEGPSWDSELILSNCTLSVLLLAFVRQFRRNKLFRELPPPRSP